MLALAHMACEVTDSFLRKLEAVEEKLPALAELVSEYILEERPRMPMLSHTLISGVLDSGGSILCIDPSKWFKICRCAVRAKQNQKYLKCSQWRICFSSKWDMMCLMVSLNSGQRGKTVKTLRQNILMMP